MKSTAKKLNCNIGMVTNCTQPWKVLLTRLYSAVERWASAYPQIACELTSSIVIVYKLVSKQICCKQCMQTNEQKINMLPLIVNCHAATAVPQIMVTEGQVLQQRCFLMNCNGKVQKRNAFLFLHKWYYQFVANVNVFSVVPAHCKKVYISLLDVVAIFCLFVTLESKCVATEFGVE